MQNESLATIPNVVSSKQIPAPVRSAICELGNSGSDQSVVLQLADVIRGGEVCSLRPGTKLAVDTDTIVIVGDLLGKGRQGAVYSLAGDSGYCIKLGLNARSARQFRRELVAATVFADLGFRFPDIVAHDAIGRWILKSAWKLERFSATKLLEETNRQLAPSHIDELLSCVAAFKEIGLCPDLTPSNVILTGDGISFFETTAWSMSRKTGWTFESCFLPFWLPDGPSEREQPGFPPFLLSSGTHEQIVKHWENGFRYQTWRKRLIELPRFNEEWWLFE